MGNFIQFFYQIIVQSFAVLFKLAIVYLFEHDGISILITFLHCLQEGMHLSIIKLLLLDGTIIPQGFSISVDVQHFSCEHAVSLVIVLEWRRLLI